METKSGKRGKAGRHTLPDGVKKRFFIATNLDEEMNRKFLAYATERHEGVVGRALRHAIAEILAK